MVRIPQEGLHGSRPALRRFVEFRGRASRKRGEHRGDADAGHGGGHVSGLYGIQTVRLAKDRRDRLDQPSIVEIDPRRHQPSGKLNILTGGRHAFDRGEDVERTEVGRSLQERDLLAGNRHGEADIPIGRIDLADDARIQRQGFPVELLENVANGGIERKRTGVDRQAVDHGLGQGKTELIDRHLKRVTSDAKIGDDEGAGYGIVTPRSIADDREAAPDRDHDVEG